MCALVTATSLINWGFIVPVENIKEHQALEITEGHSVLGASIFTW